MNIILRYALLLMSVVVGIGAFAQGGKWRDVHKVKAGETVFGIARDYGITADELIKANPDMGVAGYTLKQGDYVFIPYSSAQTAASSKAAPVEVPEGTLRVGVVLPLHNTDGDGRRMVEYYRGMLMACEDLKKEGMSIAVNAWNVPIDADIYRTLVKEDMPKCDIVFGPLYSKQVKPLSYFVKDNDIKLVIPFSITGNEVDGNPNIFQVYQSVQDFNADVIGHYLYRFKDYHTVVVDCNDKTSDKGLFTSTLRKKLAERGMSCSITNIHSSSDMFARAFSAAKPNMVVLNTGRSPELSTVLSMLDGLVAEYPLLKVSLFGYTDWLMYSKYNTGRFCKYDTYIPTHFYYNPYSSKVKAFEARYRARFKSDMMDYLPRFALTGYDHAMFFLRGMNKYGKDFNGAEEDKDALQTRLRFVKTGANGGYRNETLMFVHYNRDNSITLINF